jgi:hypothetical protein
LYSGYDGFAWEGRLGAGDGLGSLLGVFANNPSFSGNSGPGDSGRGFGPVPRRSARPGPLLSLGLVNRGAVSFEARLLLGAGLPWSPDPDLSGVGLLSSGYGARYVRESDVREDL